MGSISLSVVVWITKSGFSRKHRKVMKLSGQFIFGRMFLSPVSIIVQIQSWLWLAQMLGHWLFMIFKRERLLEHPWTVLMKNLQGLVKQNSRWSLQVLQVEKYLLLLFLLYPTDLIKYSLFSMKTHRNQTPIWVWEQYPTVTPWTICF